MNRGSLQVITMLARWPELGRCKTRLAEKLGPELAGRIYQSMLRLCVANARKACEGESPSRNLLVFVEPADRQQDMAKWLAGNADIVDSVQAARSPPVASEATVRRSVTALLNRTSRDQSHWWARIDVRPQSTGDLGWRMLDAARSAFRLGGSAVLVIGSDCPHLTAGRMDAAFDALTSCPVVLGPAHDGGYYLIGLSKMVERLFDPLDWGSGGVFQATVERCERLGIKPAVLETLSDVDRPADLTDDVLDLLGIDRSEFEGRTAR